MKNMYWQNDLLETKTLVLGKPNEYCVKMKMEQILF